MTAYKGAINNSQKQGCPDTEKIGYAEEGPFISHIEYCKRTVFYLFIFTIVFLKACFWCIVVHLSRFT